MTPEPLPATTLSADALGAAVDAFRTTSPLVHCLTNIVVAQWTANVVLAAGGAPAMVDSPHEAGDFARIPVPGGVLVNLGTPQDHTVAAMRLAAAGANEAGRPWVLDPVAAGGPAWRTSVARELLELRPAILRGNASEIGALAGGAGGRGVDSTDAPEQVLDAARALASTHGIVVAVSGPVDHLTDGDRLVRVSNGHPWLTRVTGVGCALGALMAGFAGVIDDRLVAAAAATGLLTVAADDAAASTQGPGSFAVALLDRLSTLTPDELAARVVLS
ncbi:MAG: hydroxyethylthiazole kinase [Propioniciclava sp.]|uniref:hydroxyethylthiazole kinase n=1 Tax=Propioniciclava sp. TaxID=2038686 RepID=UPI0039E4DE1C